MNLSEKNVAKISTSKQLARAFLKALRSTVIIVFVALVVFTIRTGGIRMDALRSEAIQVWPIFVMIFMFVAVWDFWWARIKQPLVANTAADERGPQDHR